MEPTLHYSCRCHLPLVHSVYGKLINHISLQAIPANSFSPEMFSSRYDAETDMQMSLRKYWTSCKIKYTYIYMKFHLNLHIDQQSSLIKRPQTTKESCIVPQNLPDVPKIHLKVS